MADDSGSGATPWLAFVVGGLVVIVAIIVFFVYSRGGAPAPAKSVDIKIDAPSIPDAPNIPEAPIPQPK